MVAPQVLVVVELRLARTGVLPAEDPHLPPRRGRDDSLVGAARGRTGRALDLAPLLALGVVHEEVGVQLDLQRGETV